MRTHQTIKFIGFLIGIVSILKGENISKNTKKSHLRWPQELPWAIRRVMLKSNLTTVPRMWDYNDQRPQCEGYISADSSWGWGNQISELFSVFGYAIMYDMKNIMLKAEVRDRFGKVFPAMKAIPAYDELPCKIDNYVEVPLKKGLKFNHTLNLVSHRFAQDGRIGFTFRKEILQLFDFAENIKEVIRNTKARIKATQRQRMGLKTALPITLVGIQCRRTDYINHIVFFGGLSVTEYYYYKAMDIMRTKFGPNIAFVIASDDLLWIREKFGHYSQDVYFAVDYYQDVGGESFVFDFALLASLDHIIISPGTFSSNAGYFIDGDVIFPDCRFQGRLHATMGTQIFHLSHNWHSLTDPSFVSIPNLTYAA